MKSAWQHHEHKEQRPVESRGIAVPRQLGLAAITVFAICALTLFEDPRAAGLLTEVSTERTRASSKSTTGSLASDYSKFEHSSPKEHRDLMGRENCASCHRRSDASTQPRFPLHKDCTGCHLVQFTASNSSPINPICTICHKAEDLNSSKTAPKNFPPLINFTSEFDHAQHLQGIESARPANGCAACHTPANRGVAETIPAPSNAHKICYDCHSPGKQASNSSSCGSCHRFGRHSPTSTAARAYRMGFSHADHGPRARLNCDRCHDVRGRGLPQARQVSSIAPVQHLPNPRACVTCHNGQRAFRDEVKGNFENCRRCHQGVKFGS